MLRSVGWRPEEPAERASDHVLYSRGTTNSNLVVTPDGDVLVNTGVSNEGPRHRERYESLLGRRLKVRGIILTQYHSDHVGGWSAFTGPGVETIANCEQPRLRAEWKTLTPYYQPRGMRFLSESGFHPQQCLGIAFCIVDGVVSVLRLAQVLEVDEGVTLQSLVQRAQVC